MGCNYYLSESEPCEACGRPYDLLHIGKSSGGWCFSLHVEPDDPQHPQSLEDWQARWSLPGVTITDEYGRELSPDEMNHEITWRSGPTRWSERELRVNGAERGPNNLARHLVDFHHCVGHGPGTWDLVVGDFS